MSGTTSTAPATPGSGNPGISVVVFDYATWSTLYPQFAGVNAVQAGLYFQQATLYLDNTPGSAVQNLVKRALILNMLTAHIAALGLQAAKGGLVGRVSSASEGSVSVSTDYQVTKGAEWFAQTPYGAAAWQAMAAYRTFRYIPGPGRRAW